MRVESEPESYAARLLGDLGFDRVEDRPPSDEHPAISWATSGLMQLTPGHDGSPTLCPVPLTRCADDALWALRQLSGENIMPGVAGHHLLAERAAITGMYGSDNQAPSEHCRLLQTRNGWIGLNMARPSDWELVPAWLQRELNADWATLAEGITDYDSTLLVERGRLLGLAVVDACYIPDQPCNWVTQTQHGGKSPPAENAEPLVVDLSSLWAGPLCSKLWQQAGARVIKVESERRPDGARQGCSEFFRCLSQDKEMLTLPLQTSAGREQLKELLMQADIVLEASRPRALRQMDIVAEDILAASPGLTWVSITGYGREAPQGHWIAYGDDAGIAAGLSAILHRVCGEWLICGDAIADPLTALHAALAGWASWKDGGGKLMALSLEQTIRHCITTTAPADNDYQTRQKTWLDMLQQHSVDAVAPSLRCKGQPRSC